MWDKTTQPAAAALPSWPVALKLPGVRLYWKPCLCSPRTPPYRACAVPQPFSTPAVCGQHSSGKGTRPEGHAWGQELHAGVGFQAVRQVSGWFHQLDGVSCASGGVTLRSSIAQLFNEHPMTSHDHPSSMIIPSHLVNDVSLPNSKVERNPEWGANDVRALKNLKIIPISRNRQKITGCILSLLRW